MRLRVGLQEQLTLRSDCCDRSARIREAEKTAEHGGGEVPLRIIEMRRQAVFTVSSRLPRPRKGMFVTTSVKRRPGNSAAFAVLHAATAISSVSSLSAAARTAPNNGSSVSKSVVRRSARPTRVNQAAERWYFGE